MPSPRPTGSFGMARVPLGSWVPSLPCAIAFIPLTVPQESPVPVPLPNVVAKLLKKRYAAVRATVHARGRPINGRSPFPPGVPHTRACATPASERKRRRRQLARMAPWKSSVPCCPCARRRVASVVQRLTRYHTRRGCGRTLRAKPMASASASIASMCLFKRWCDGDGRAHTVDAGSVRVLTMANRACAV